MILLLRKLLGLSSIEDKILHVLEKSGKTMTIANIAQHVPSHRNTIRTILARLHKRGIVLVMRKNNRHPKYIYNTTLDRMHISDLEKNLKAFLNGDLTDMGDDDEETGLPAGF